MARKLGFLALILLAGIPALASTGTISGYVKDSSGTPQIGAVVEVFTSAATLGTIVFTNDRGFFAVGDLLPGVYQVKVSALAFLPALRENVALRSGGRVLVNVTLNTLADVQRLLPPRRSGASDPDDWHWTLNSAGNRPVLRAVDNGATTAATTKDKRGEPSDSSSLGTFVSEKPEVRALKTRLAFIAGSDADGFGSSGDVTTSFALEKSIFSSGMLFFDGNVAASNTNDPSGVLRASYAHDFGASSQPALAITYRHFASPGMAVGNSPYGAIEVNTSDHMTVGDIIDLQYGAALESVEFSKRVSTFRPYGTVTVHLSPDTVVEYRYATSEPNTRAAKGFDSAPADLSESGPKMALAGGVPDVERAQHQEVSVSRRFGKTSIQAAFFDDHVRNLILTGAGDPTSYSDDVLPDVYSATFSYAYGGGMNTTGARVVVERKLLDELTATVDYSVGGAVTAADGTGSWQSLPQFLTTTRQQSVGTKVSGHIHASGTRWICSYKWSSGNAVYPVDAFNASPGQTDPFLSVFVRQPLPGFSFMPARMDVLLDLRNLLAQGYMPVMGPDGRTVYLLQSARSLRAGLAFSF